MGQPPLRKDKVANTVVQAREGDDLNSFLSSSHHLYLKPFRRPEFWILHMPFLAHPAGP